MFGKIIISRVLVSVFVLGVFISGSFVYAGPKIEKAKTVLRTAAKVTALGFTTALTVNFAMNMVNDDYLLTMMNQLNADYAKRGLFFRVNRGAVMMAQAVCAVWCGIASYKLAKGLVKSHKNRNVSTDAVQATTEVVKTKESGYVA